GLTRPRRSLTELAFGEKRAVLRPEAAESFLCLRGLFGIFQTADQGQTRRKAGTQSHRSNASRKAMTAGLPARRKPFEVEQGREARIGFGALAWTARGGPQCDVGSQPVDPAGGRLTEAHGRTVACVAESRWRTKSGGCFAVCGGIWERAA